MTIQTKQSEIYTANQGSFTFHVRVTKKCNADCSYCSSFERQFSELMSLENLEKSMNFISQFISKYSLGGVKKAVTVQYVGGELLTLPVDYFRKFTQIIEDKLSHNFGEVIQSGQSNLIGSKDKIIELYHTLDGHIGSSLDISTAQRTIRKSSKKYDTIFIKNLDVVKKMTGKFPSSIIVIDEKMKPFLFDNIKFAEEKKMHLTLRPVFQGGMPVETLNENSLTDIYTSVFQHWFMKSNIAIEPLMGMVQKRLMKDKIYDDDFGYISGCNFQHNCATSSINLEPDGTLYVCLDMADGKHYPIGNAIKEEIYEDTFNLLMSRTEKLNKDCLSCNYFSACQGGCMNEAIEQKNDVFGKTEYCSTWKVMFKLIDESIEKFGESNVKNWIKKLGI